MLKHKDIIGRPALSVNIHGDNVDFKAGRLCHLPEPHQDIIGKLMGFFILDIVFLNNNTELSLCVFIASEPGIAKFSFCRASLISGALFRAFDTVPFDIFSLSAISWIVVIVCPPSFAK